MVQGRPKLKKLKVFKKSQKQLTEAQKASIITSHSYGTSSRQIALQLKRHHSTIDLVIDKYQATQSVERIVGSGRPRKTTKKEDRRIVRSVANNRRISSPQILEENGITNISDRTARRRIKEEENASPKHLKSSLRSCKKVGKLSQ
jgi:IS30 family transposase